MSRLRKNSRIGKLAKAVGLVSVMAFVGLALPLFYGQNNAVNAQPVTASQPIRPVAVEAKPVAAQSDLEADTRLVLGGLRMSGELGLKN